MDERNEGGEPKPTTAAETGRATPAAIAQVARILRRRRSARRERERAELPARPTARVSRPPL